MLAILLTAMIGAPDLYVKVPYQGAFDELIEKKVVNGQLPLPKRMRIHNEKVQMQDGNGKWFDCGYLLLADHFFGCHYDNDGNYYVPLDFYKKLEKELIHRHQGRLEYFALPNTPFGSLDPKHFELYVWDADDKVWRWHTTLNRVPEDHKLKNGELLSKQTVDPKLQTGVIEELLKKRRR